MLWVWPGTLTKQAVAGCGAHLVPENFSSFPLQGLAREEAQCGGRSCAKHAKIRMPAEFRGGTAVGWEGQEPSWRRCKVAMLGLSLGTLLLISK